MVNNKTIALIVSGVFAVALAIVVGLRLSTPVVMAAVFGTAVGLGLGAALGAFLGPRKQTPAPPSHEAEGMVSVMLTEEEVDILFELLERGIEQPTSQQDQPAPAKKAAPKSRPTRPRPNREFTAVGGATIPDDDEEEETYDA